MNLIYILLYLISILAVRFISTTIRENKLYAISTNGSDNSFQVTAYELKDGSIKDIFSNGRSSSLIKLGRGFDLKFFDVPNTLQEYHGKIWLRAEQTSPNPETSSLNSSFMGYINLSDMTFKADSSFIKFPTDENFPLFGYTINTITNEHESALYIIGGVIYSKSTNSYISSNSVFKYNFVMKEWKDMTPDDKGKLNPVYGHTSVVVNNMTLILIGGRVAKDPTKDATLNISEDSLFKVSSIYSITNFHTIGKTWQSTIFNTSMFNSSIASLQLTEFSANFYDDKVYILGGLAASNEKQTQDINSRLVILDYIKYQWSWFEIVDYTGNVYSSSVEAKSSLLLDDQIILTSGKPVDKDSDGFQIFSLDNQRLQPTLKFKSDKGSSDKVNDQSALPSYTVVLIAVGSTALLLIVIFYAYIRYKRNKESSLDYDNEPNELLEAFFSEPKEPDMEYILLGIKKDGIYFNTDIWYSGWIWENSMFEKANVTQVYLPLSPESNGTSPTLHSNSSNFQHKKLQDSTLIEFNN